MNKRSLRINVFLVALTILIFSGLSRASAHSAPAASATTLPEGKDFATHILRDPWDMSQFTDISIELNNSGQTDYLTNYTVANGIFSAHSTSLADAQFFLLYPGSHVSATQNAINAGKYGINYPISASTYHCFYVAMQVNSDPLDYYIVLWFADTHMSDGTSPWGYSKSLPVSPSIWKLYQVDLSQSGTVGGGVPWTGNATWQGVRVDPTNRANVDFAVDWARLTDCSAVNTTVTWTPDARGNTLWLTSGSTGNQIQVKSGIAGSSGSTTLDTQGLAAGTYTVGLGDTTTCCYQSGSSFTINQAPVATFNRPSPYSGVDYATQAGNAWDFKDPADVAQALNVQWSLGGGLLNMTTASGTPQNIADPIIYLNTPQIIATGSQYRYLTYRLYTQWPLQNLPQGMIVRWIWAMSNGCTLVSYDIPFDVGWQIYSIDLGDPVIGTPEVAVNCPPGPYHWNTSTSISRLRFDPNENILGANLFQQLDWIRLTQVDSVTHGTPFPVQMSLNKPPQGMTFSYYYTTDRQQPTQHIAVPYTASQRSLSLSSSPLYLPFVSVGTDPNTDLPPVVNGVSFKWDTTSVVPGIYYVCVNANDTVNQGIYCSDAPVRIN